MDGPINSSDALLKYETSILNIANREGIDVSVKAMLAQEEITTGLHLFLDRTSVRSQAFLAAPRASVKGIVVTDPLKRWHAFKTLAVFYRDAYNNQLNDRYKGKWTEYEQLSTAAAQTLFRAGVGIVHYPVPKASDPLLTVIPIGVTGTSYYVRISWINAFGDEGAASNVQQAATGDGSATVVASAIGYGGIESWNVYAGNGPDDLQLQSVPAIPIGGTWIMPPSGLISGRAPGDGQAPEHWIIDRHVVLRG
jgi:hypothetical protein